MDKLQVLENPIFIIVGDVQKAIDFCHSHKDFDLFRYELCIYKGEKVLDIGLGQDNSPLEFETIYREFAPFLPVGKWPDIHYELRLYK